MTRLSKRTVEEILTVGLGLKEPRFKLEKSGDWWSGSVISKTFKRKRDHQRQKMIWDVLRSSLGTDARRFVGMILAYTPEEWDIDDLILMPAKRKSVKSHARRAKQGTSALAG